MGKKKNIIIKRVKLRDLMTDRLKEAHEFATKAHDDQTTPGSNKHYMLSLASTAEIGAQYGLTETGMIACILKDTLKLTPVRLDQIKDTFRINVSMLVEELSSPEIVWSKDADKAIAVIKVAESIDAVSRLSSNRFGNDYKLEVLAKAKRLLESLEPFSEVLHDDDLDLVGILAELKTSCENAVQFIEEV
jgi:hypothetical protein